MCKFSDKLWNWGHLERSHNKCTGFNCSMTPEEFAKEYGIPNAFIVSYGGNIQPPYGEMAKRFSCLRRVKWPHWETQALRFQSTVSETLPTL